MDWNSNLRTFVPRPEQTASFDFLYNYNYTHYPPGMEMKHAGIIGEKVEHGLVQGGGGGGGGIELIKSYASHHHHHQDLKKKRLTSDQLESLERSFQEEIKLDPDRKMKLSRELGLQPRQIAVWFQNRRARWKSKQLEMLYDALKQEYDDVSREKQKLQQEVIKLKSMLRDKGMTRKQVSTGHTEVSGEETVESTSVGIRSTNKTPRGGGGGIMNQQQQQQINGGDQCNNYVFNVEEYNNAVAAASPYWGVLPSYP